MKESLEVTAAQFTEVLRPYAELFTVTAQSETGISLSLPGRSGPVSFFGAVVLRKNYVAVHLMPVYVYPELLNDLSPALKKRMQGKSCFNFKEFNAGFTGEISGLIERCITKYRETGYLA